LFHLWPVEELDDESDCEYEYGVERIEGVEPTYPIRPWSSVPCRLEALEELREKLDLHREMGAGTGKRTRSANLIFCEEPSMQIIVGVGTVVDRREGGTMPYS
jgi:hypothetical protein